MLIPIALVVGLLIATAIIAHVADNLGKRLGKKRVSLFGLRPRTSATIATVGSGWAIMLFTLFVLLLVVTPLRNALLHYETVVQQIKSAQASLNRKQAELSRTQADLLRTRGNLSKAQQSVAAIQQQAQTFKVSAQKSREQAQDFQEKAQSARRGEQSARRGAQAEQRIARLAQVSARSAQAAAGVAVAQQRQAQEALEGTRRALQESKARLAESQASLKEADRRLIDAKARVATANDKVVAAYKEVVTSFKELAQAKSQAKLQVQVAQNQVQAAKNQVARYQKQATELEVQYKVLENKAVELSTRVNSLDDYADLLESAEIRLAVDQTLAERRFDATRSPAEIARELRILVEAAHAGTQNFIKGATLTVGVGVPSKSGGNTIYFDEQAIDFYANVLASANQTVSGRLVSSSNYPSNTTAVLARFVFIPIRTIYMARENIAEATIDTNKSESAIFGQLQDLVDVARVNAVKRGAAPPLSPEAKNFFDGDTGPKIFEALREVQKYAHPVQVRIVAARELDSAEPLQVRFLVGDQT